MKRIVSTLLVCIFIVGCMAVLASCGGKTLDGNYSSESGATNIYFSGDNAVILISVNISGYTNSAAYEAKYEISGGKIKFTYEDGKDRYSVFDGEYSFESAEENGKEYIKINGVTYNKK